MKDLKGLSGDVTKSITYTQSYAISLPQKKKKSSAALNIEIFQQV